MEYARIELMLIRGGWTRGIAVPGAVAGQVKSVIVDTAQWTIAQTIVAPKVARHLAPVASATDAPELASAISLTNKSVARSAKGVIGRVSRVWVDRRTGRVSHLLLRAPRGGKAEYVVDAKHIAAFDALGVSLHPGADGLFLLPLYRPDAVIASDARMALGGVLADPRARRAVKLHVEDGEVLLSGEVDTVEQAHLAEWAVTRVPGVRRVVVDLAAQEQLAAEVEARIAALGLPGQNGHVPVQVLSEHGIVYLEGSVPSAQLRARVEAAALGATGARVVVNNLRVAGEPPDRGQGTGPLTRNR
jgi:osmotically-inducible protein OsmY/sporulation protein YlmC with PRC-barrel domain